MVIGNRAGTGAKTMASSGTSAPMVNDSMDARAACHGFV